MTTYWGISIRTSFFVVLVTFYYIQVRAGRRKRLTEESGSEAGQLHGEKALLGGKIKGIFL